MDKLIKPRDVPGLTDGAISSAKDFCRRARRGDFPRTCVVRVGGRVYATQKLLTFLEGGGGPPGAFAPRSTEAAEPEAGR